MTTYGGPYFVFTHMLYRECFLLSHVRIICRFQRLDAKAAKNQQCQGLGPAVPWNRIDSGMRRYDGRNPCGATNDCPRCCHVADAGGATARRVGPGQDRQAGPNGHERRAQPRYSMEHESPTPRRQSLGKNHGHNRYRSVFGTTRRLRYRSRPEPGWQHGSPTELTVCRTQGGCQIAGRRYRPPAPACADRLPPASGPVPDARCTS